MRRREFVIGGLSAAALPSAVKAQQPLTPVIGVLLGGSLDAYAPLIAAFVGGLKATGFVAGENVSIEYRWANGQYDRLPEMAVELVHRPVALIVAATPVAAMAAKKTTGSIPIVFALGSDPVKDGLVPNLNKPGGNTTGATFFTNLLDKKRIGLIRQLFPNAEAVAILINPKNPEADMQTLDAEEAARSLGLELLILRASTQQEINNLDFNIAQKRPAALLIAGDAFFVSQNNRIVEIATRYAIPTYFAGRSRAVTAGGGLLSYGASMDDTYRQAGNYAGRILKGERPGDLPVQQPTKFRYHNAVHAACDRRRGHRVKRREFIVLAIGGAAAWPLAVQGQQQSVPVIGVLSTGSSDGFASRLRAFDQALHEKGFIEGHNVKIEYRFAHDQYARLPTLAAELISLHPAVVVTNYPATISVKAATATIPILFVTGGDPVKLGLVQSLKSTW